MNIKKSDLAMYIFAFLTITLLLVLTIKLRKALNIDHVIPERSYSIEKIKKLEEDLEDKWEKIYTKKEKNSSEKKEKFEKGEELIEEIKYSIEQIESYNLKQLNKLHEKTMSFMSLLYKNKRDDEKQNIKDKLESCIRVIVEINQCINHLKKPLQRNKIM